MKIVCLVVITVFLMAVGCAAPKPVKLDGAEKAPVNSPEMVKVLNGGEGKGDER